MHLISSWKQGLIIGGIALAAIIAVVALASQSSPTPQTSYANLASSNTATLANPEPVSRDTEPGFANRESPQDAGPPAVYATSPFTPSEPRAAIPMPAPPLMETAPPVVENSMVARETAMRPVGRRRRVYYSRRRRHGRPFSHSVAIVGGSAAGGALIGGLAGGGKGAGIGALAGGAGGLIYDRATAHKK